MQQEITHLNDVFLLALTVNDSLTFFFKLEEGETLMRIASNTHFENIGSMLTTC